MSKQKNIPWYLRKDGTCDCVPPFTCCPLCCKNWNNANCILNCIKKFDKYNNPIMPEFAPIEGNIKTVKVIKLNILEKIIFTVRDKWQKEILEDESQNG